MHLRIIRFISITNMSSKCMAVSIITVSTMMPRIQTCSSSGSKKLSKTYHDIRGENTRYGECKEERNSSSGYRNCFEACNFSSECEYWSGDGFSEADFLWGCPRLADDNRGCSCKHGFCFFSGGNPEGYPKIPDEYRCSVYNDCECRWIAVWKKSYINY